MSEGHSRDRDIGRKWDSGASKIKRKVELIASNQAMSAAMKKFLKKLLETFTPQSDESLIQCSEAGVASEFKEFDVQISTPTLDAGEFSIDQLTELHKTFEIEKISDLKNEEQAVQLRASFVNLDPRRWVFPITDSQHHDLISNDPQKNVEKFDENHPKDYYKRHFSNFYFTRKLSNNETQRRTWLVYSKCQDKVYCFPCRLFSHMQTLMVKEGCCDWIDLSRILQRHEQSQGHRECMIDWIEFYKRITHGKTIDKENGKLIRESQKYWYNLF
ncbi:zinc finger MYM-type protein 5-like [Teleopsis dalmanni]|uniref:zinc finger MYM-type protein 5-like n=1 Tax=Teleopsis dalmanni TaxID=139649 RepID=UPI0018CFD353|nr:zinc finger MYM-type protein 5-like [Teleopsis dalmanni]